jgi:hypothetical protein
VAASWPTVSFDNTLRTTPTLFKVLTVTPAQKAADAAVFPFSSSYKTYVGDCTGNDPSTYGAVASGAQVNPGQTKTVSLPMRTVTVTVNGSTTAQKTTLLVAPDKTIGTAMSSCAATTYSNPGWTVIGSGTAGTVIFKIAVPYGVWKVCANHQYSNSKWAQTATVTGGSTADDPLVSTPAGTTGTYVPDLSTTLTMPGASTQSGAFLTC